MSDAITTRPWNGRCWTTGRTMDEFAESFEFGSQYRDEHGDWPEWMTRAAVAICRSYGIKGICDPAYIANVIHGEMLGVRQ